jgi:hypothetical protein
MLNSCTFIFGFLLVRTPVDRTLDLLRVVLCVLWRAVDADLATVTIRVRTKEPAPMTHLSPVPIPVLGVSNRHLDFLAGMPGSICHMAKHNLSNC